MNEFDFTENTSASRDGKHGGDFLENSLSASASGTPNERRLNAIAVFADGSTETGLTHDENQDSYGIWGHAACVCDGVGGSARASFASEVVRNAALKACCEGCPPGEALLKAHAVLLAGRELLREAGASEAPSSQTAAVLACWDSLPTFRVASVGDCRAYLVRRGRVEAITPSGRPDLGSNRMEAALGAEMDLAPFVYEAEIELEKDDRVVLCTDGVWDLPGFEERASEALISSSNPFSAAISLSSKSRERGYDDATVVVIYSKEER